MDGKEFGERYVAEMDKIANVLKKEKIYDEDLVHDTYIDMYEWAQSHEPREFVGTFVDFYKKRYRRQEVRERECDAMPPETMRELRIYDDHSNVARNEAIGEVADTILQLLDEVELPGERKPEQHRRVLRLWMDGQSYEEIGREMGMSPHSAKSILQRLLKKVGKIVREEEKRQKARNECIGEMAYI